MVIKLNNRINTVKVLSICTSDSSGGAARAAYRIHRAVKTLGIDSQMFVKNKETKDDDVIALEEFIPTNPFYEVFDWVRNKMKNKIQHHQWGRYPGKASYYISDLRSTDICGALNRLDYDVLHLHWVNQRFLPLEQLPKDKPIIWTLHDSWPFCGVCHYFFDCERYRHECGCCPMLGSRDALDLSHIIWTQKKNLYRNLDLHIVTPSRWLGNCAKSSSLLGRFPVEVIPNSLNTSVFCPLPMEKISPVWRKFREKRLEKPVLLYGAMNAVTDKIKGFSNLLSALQLLEKQGKADAFELIVFGTDTPLEGIPTSMPIHYVGYVSDVQELVSLYNLASVMVVPSLTENLSCTIMESLSCGTPVVAFDIGGNRDMIDHQLNGYLARERDDADLAAGILWCLDHNKNGQLSQNARQKVQGNFTSEVVGKQYADLYRRVLS